MSAIYDRQNDEKGMMYIRAAKFCQRQKSKITYYMIIISLLMTLASIAVKIVDNIVVSNGAALSARYSQAVVLISAVVLIGNIFCAFLEHEFNVMSVNLMERYDMYVFGLPANRAIMRSIADQTIVNYARKYKNKKKILALRNYYFKTPEQADQKHAAFSNIKKSYEFSHRLLIDVHAFFVFLWVCYAILIVLIAFIVSSQDLFIETVINIFIPSLSTISLIAGSARRYNEQSRKLANCVNVATDFSVQAAKKNANVSLNSPYVLRCLQDAIFSQRVNEFTVPDFMVKKFANKLKREENMVIQEPYLTDKQASKIYKQPSSEVAATTKKQPSNEVAATTKKQPSNEVAATKNKSSEVAVGAVDKQTSKTKKQPSNEVVATAKKQPSNEVVATAKKQPSNEVAATTKKKSIDKQTSKSVNKSNGGAGKQPTKASSKTVSGTAEASGDAAKKATAGTSPNSSTSSTKKKSNSATQSGASAVKKNPSEIKTTAKGQTNKQE